MPWPSHSAQRPPAVLKLSPQRTAFGQEQSFANAGLPARQAMQLKSPFGMRFEGLPGQPGDHRIYAVVDMAGDTLALDGYHPLAGGTLDLTSPCSP